MLQWSWIYGFFVASEWIIRIVMLIYVPRRRTSAAARSWMLLIFIEPWIGLVLYSLFGRAFLPPRRLNLQQRVHETLQTIGKEFFSRYFTKPALPSQFLQAINLAERLGDFPVVAGNRLELISHYDEAIDRLIADIESAKHHCHLLYYIFAADSTGKRVAAAIRRAADRGVQCRMLLDSHGARDALTYLAPDLRDAGVEIHELLPVRFFDRSAARIDLRNHRKLAVIDGRVAYIGSQNMINADSADGLVNEELVVRATGPVVMQLQAVFLTDRFLETAEDLREPDLFPETAYTGESATQVLPSGPGYPHLNIQSTIVSLLHAAEHHVVMTTPYFVPDESLLHALKSAAIRGVKVQLVVSQQLDHWLVGLAQRSYYEELLESGIEILEYRSGLLHAKHLTIDNTVAVIGSSNLDLRSFVLNAEISLLVYDPLVAVELSEINHRNFAESHPLTLEEWRLRPFHLKVLQNCARLVDSLL